MNWREFGRKAAFARWVRRRDANRRDATLLGGDTDRRDATRLGAGLGHVVGSGRRRAAIAAVAAIMTVAVLAACDPEPVIHTGALPSPSASDSPSPSASPSPSDSPSPSPTTQSPKPPPPAPGPKTVNCNVPHVDSGRAQATNSSSTFPGTTTVTTNATVALTFDDGPEAVTTPKILDILRQCGVHATFCVNGIKAQANPTLIRRIWAEGHTFCNHTWRHITQLGNYGQPLIEQDLTDTNNAIKAIVPDAKIGYFRAPGGAWTSDYIVVAKKLGMTPLHWDVDPSDWNGDKYGHGQSMINHIISNVESDTRPGSVILSHDYSKPDTLAAYMVLLPWLKARFDLEALPREGLNLG